MEILVLCCAKKVPKSHCNNIYWLTKLTIDMILLWCTCCWRNPLERMCVPHSITSLLNDSLVSKVKWRSSHQLSSSMIWRAKEGRAPEQLYRLLLRVHAWKVFWLIGRNSSADVLCVLPQELLVQIPRSQRPCHIFYFVQGWNLMKIDHRRIISQKSSQEF